MSAVLGSVPPRTDSQTEPEAGRGRRRGKLRLPTPDAEAAQADRGSCPARPGGPPRPAQTSPPGRAPMPRRNCGRPARPSPGAACSSYPEDGCLIDHPVLLSDLGNGVALEPPALLGCPIARATVDFMRDEVGPAAERHLDTAPKALVQVSAMSAGHGMARIRSSAACAGNHLNGVGALDWGAIVLENGNIIDIREAGTRSSRRTGLSRRHPRGGLWSLHDPVLGPGTRWRTMPTISILTWPNANSAFCR